MPTLCVAVEDVCMREIRCPPPREEAAGDDQESLGLLVITTHDLCSSLICHSGNKLNKNLAALVLERGRQSRDSGTTCQVLLCQTIKVRVNRGESCRYGGPLEGCDENRIYLHGLPPQSHRPHLIRRKAASTF